ncbi:MULTISPECIES: ankyrin repeat domain-containing protein [Paenibacillus]|uniref:Ankyrin repeat domain-containing protein n=1 Tax=Paenibacillus albilobatus TaxID=2716884 RepID=A0A920C9R0_9BACL|nr:MULTISPECIES: ankyrin repeat domain-containing protein [Paenibacillus]GIO29424.1 hypothetical protein J2TS6_05650 [Paenibacillus albilobatus]
MNWNEVGKSKDVDSVRLAAERLDPNERDARGRTPLMLCITNRMPAEGIRLLLEKGADLEAEDKLGDTALKKAVKFKQTETVKLLLEFGAKLDSPHGILGTAWNAARLDETMADLLLNTKGAVRLTLDKQEREIVDGILCLESAGKSRVPARILNCWEMCDDEHESSTNGTAKDIEGCKRKDLRVY